MINSNKLLVLAGVALVPALANAAYVFFVEDDSTFLIDDNQDGTIDRDFRIGGSGRDAVVGVWDAGQQFGYGVESGGALTIFNQDESVRNIVGGFNGTALAGDWDGDGVDELANYNAGTWTVYNANTGTLTGNVGVFAHGNATFTPLIGDWNNDGNDDANLINSAFSWIGNNSASAGGNIGSFLNGGGTDIGFMGDHDGDGAEEAILFRDNGSLSYTIYESADLAPYNAGTGATLTYDLTSWMDNGETITNAFYVVPEPSSYALLAGFLALSSVMVRRRR